MKRMSGKQRCAQIKAARSVRRERRSLIAATPDPVMPHLGRVACEPALLVPDGSYGTPEFVRRGYYEDMAFVCKDCGVAGVWTAKRQKWWYEVAKGRVWTRAVRCKACRAKERARKEIARRQQAVGQGRLNDGK